MAYRRASHTAEPVGKHRHPRFLVYGTAEVLGIQRIHNSRSRWDDSARHRPLEKTDRRGDGCLDGRHKHRLYRHDSVRPPSFLPRPSPAAGSAYGRNRNNDRVHCTRHPRVCASVEWLRI